MPDRAVADIGLRHLLHGDGRLNPDDNAQFLQHIRHSQRVHGGPQHADMIRPGAVHRPAGTAPPKVAAADNDGDFHP